jgi:hypothetical protein
MYIEYKMISLDFVGQAGCSCSGVECSTQKQLHDLANNYTSLSMAGAVTTGRNLVLLL